MRWSPFWVSRRRTPGRPNFRDPRVAAVAAETLPSLIASQTVLIRNGFSLVSRRADDDLGEILRFALRRPG